MVPCATFRKTVAVVFGVGVVLLIFASGPPSSAAIVIDDGDTGFSSDNLTPYNSAKTFNGNYRYGYPDTSGNARATWTPSAVTGFEPDEEYFVQINWGIWGTHGIHDIRVTHAGGQITTAVDMTKFAAQGTSLGSLPVPATNETSGWYTLGRFALDGNSKVELFGGSDTSKAFSADAVRFSKVFGGEGLIIDETSAGVVYLGSWGQTTRISTSSVPQSIQYRYSSGNHADAAVDYLLGTDYTGPAEVSVSWGVHSNQSDLVNYLLDLDGDINTTADQTLFTVSQQLMADQATSGNENWSGWYSLGIHAIGPDTKVFLKNQTGSYLAADALLIAPIPEPSTAALLGFGLMAVLATGRRRKK